MPSHLSSIGLKSSPVKIKWHFVPDRSKKAHAKLMAGQRILVGRDPRQNLVLGDLMKRGQLVDRSPHVPRRQYGRVEHNVALGWWICRNQFVAGQHHGASSLAQVKRLEVRRFSGGKPDPLRRQRDLNDRLIGRVQNQREIRIWERRARREIDRAPGSRSSRRQVSDGGPDIPVRKDRHADAFAWGPAPAARNNTFRPPCTAASEDAYQFTQSVSNVPAGSRIPRHASSQSTTPLAVAVIIEHKLMLDDTLTTPTRAAGLQWG